MSFCEANIINVLNQEEVSTFAGLNLFDFVHSVGLFWHNIENLFQDVFCVVLVSNQREEHLGI